MPAVKLDKLSRDALPADEFAVPAKRKLPMHDERHVRLAWEMVERTEGLSFDERGEARGRIIAQANKLGLDTADWHKMKSMRLEAMALNIESDDDHPNKMPFRGVLTRVGLPSDEPPGGSGGRRVILTNAAAEKALGSLLGMAVDYMPTFDGHDPKAKIGLITAAHIVGTALEIEGFIYAADFPDVAERIRADKSVLGFSFEAQRIYVNDPGSDPLEITECVFTGAAILRKDKAAYQTTSLAAQADKGSKMDPEELKKMLAEALGPINAQIEKTAKELEDRLKALEANKDLKIEANAATMARVEPHAAALDSCAAAMEADGIGVAENNGHVTAIRKMAGAMRADAAQGKIPHIWRDHDYPYYANNANNANLSANKDIEDMDAKAITAAVEAAMKPLLEKHVALETQIKDLQAAARVKSPEPERKSVSPTINSLLAKAQLTLPEGDDKLSIAVVDKALSNAGLTGIQRMQLKSELTRAGVLA